MNELIDYCKLWVSIRPPRPSVHIIDYKQGQSNQSKGCVVKHKAIYNRQSLPIIETKPIIITKAHTPPSFEKNHQLKAPCLGLPVLK